MGRQGNLKLFLITDCDSNYIMIINFIIIIIIIIIITIKIFVIIVQRKIALQELDKTPIPGRTIDNFSLLL